MGGGQAVLKKQWECRISTKCFSGEKKKTVEEYMSSNEKSYEKKNLNMDYYFLPTRRLL